MLSFVYRLVRSFEQEHGVHPNLLYLSPAHLHSLRQQLDACEQMDDIVNLLGMEIIVTRETVHPHVAWTSTQWRRMAV
jgi:hypothetical protein